MFTSDTMQFCCSHMILILLGTSFLAMDAATKPKFYLSEVQPSGLEFDPKYSRLPSTYLQLVEMIDSAKKTVVFTSLYFSLLERSEPGRYNDTAGRDVFEALRKAAQRSVNIYLITSPKTSNFPSLDIDDLVSEFPKYVFPQYVDMPKISKYHNGIFHTKLLIVDQSCFYVGSSNIDYRAYTEIVEIGALGWDNEVVAGHLTKIAKMYFPDIPAKEEETFAFLGRVKQIYKSTKRYYTHIKNKHSKNPSGLSAEKILLNPDTKLYGYISVSPDEFLTTPFERDADALLSVINSAKQDLILAMMDYTSGSLYIQNRLYWDVIDSALRRAAFERKVKIRIMTNITSLLHNLKWHHMKSLSFFGNIEVKILDLPPTETPSPPYSRLWHAKFSVSESEAWLSTNNVTPDYFLTTAGIAFHFVDGGEQSVEIRKQMLDLFDKYWNSDYAVYLK